MSNINNALENQLSFILYACSKETIKSYKPHLTKFDLTYTQYLTLLVLWNKDNIGIKELGASLYLDSGTLTPILKKLETKGLISRIRDEADNRNLIISITNKGLIVKEQMSDIPHAILQETGFNQQQVQQVLDLLTPYLKIINKEE